MFFVLFFAVLINNHRNMTGIKALLGGLVVAVCCMLLAESSSSSAASASSASSASSSSSSSSSCQVCPESPCANMDVPCVIKHLWKYTHGISNAAVDFKKELISLAKEARHMPKKDRKRRYGLLLSISLWAVDRYTGMVSPVSPSCIYKKLAQSSLSNCHHARKAALNEYNFLCGNATEYTIRIGMMAAGCPVEPLEVDDSDVEECDMDGIVEQILETPDCELPDSLKHIIMRLSKSDDEDDTAIACACAGATTKSSLNMFAKLLETRELIEVLRLKACPAKIPSSCCQGRLEELTEKTNKLKKRVKVVFCCVSLTESSSSHIASPSCSSYRVCPESPCAHMDIPSLIKNLWTYPRGISDAAKDFKKELISLAKEARQMPKKDRNRRYGLLLSLSLWAVDRFTGIVSPVSPSCVYKKLADSSISNCPIARKVALDEYNFLCGNATEYAIRIGMMAAGCPVEPLEFDKSDIEECDMDGIFEKVLETPGCELPDSLKDIIIRLSESDDDDDSAIVCACAGAITKSSLNMFAKLLETKELIEVLRLKACPAKIPSWCCQGRFEELTKKTNKLKKQVNVIIEEELGDE